MPSLGCVVFKKKGTIIYKLIQIFPRPFNNTLSNSPKNIFKVIEGKKSAKCFVYKRHL